MSGRPGVHADGFRWLKGVTSDPGGFVLVNPDGHWVAIVWRGIDRTWSVADIDGPVRASGLASLGEALKVADNDWRPCAYDHGTPDGLCGNDRAEGSIYCGPHVERVKRENAVSDDMDRIEGTGGAR